MSRFAVKIVWLALAARQVMNASDPASPATNAGMADLPWVQTLTVLILTFGAAATFGYLVDSYFRAKETAGRPGVDAYIEDMMAANGLHLNRTGRRKE